MHIQVMYIVWMDGIKHLNILPIEVIEPTVKINTENVKIQWDKKRDPSQLSPQWQECEMN